MKYTIDVSEFIGTDYRLKQDGSFKKFKGKNDKDILIDDLTYDDYSRAKLWMKTHKFIEVDGKKIEVDPESSSLTDPIVEIRPHRTGKPKQSYFSEDDLKRVLLNGNDNYDNSLVIDFDGYLHLVPFRQAYDGSYAVRYETFLSGNGYVGSEESVSDVEDTYLSLLEGWATHLVGHDSIYMDCPNSSTKEKLIQEIEQAINKL